MGEMTKTALSSVEMKFADLHAKIDGCVQLQFCLLVDVNLLQCLHLCPSVT